MLLKSLVLMLAWTVQACGSDADDARNALNETSSSAVTSDPAESPVMQDAPAVPRAEENQPQVEPEPGAPAQPADPVHNLLDRLEKGAADLRTFTADVRYEKEDPLLGRKELRSGNLIYKHDFDANEKSFAILFDKVIIDGVGRAEARQYIFSGRWLVEVDPQNKQFIKREIVPPGKKFDPLKLGEGPFPLPIGQPKAEVLARFDVSPATPPDEGLLKDLKEVDGLALVPKPGGREAKEFARVELFYDRSTMLPVGIITLEMNDERKVIRLLNVKRNPDLSPEQERRLDVAEPDPREWRIDVRPWQQAE